MTAGGAGAVYDRGYRPYEGSLGGRSAARLALFRGSVRRAVGVRRSWRQKLFPWMLLAIASVPAVVWVGVAYITRDTPADAVEIISYREYLGVSTALLVFVGLAAPDVLCPDRRNRTLPLLFSRPLTGTDYVVAKVGAIAAIVFAFSFLPQVVLFVGQMLVSDGALDYVRDNAAVLWQVPVATAVFSLYLAALSCAVASLTARRLIAAAALLILLLGSSALAAGLSETTGAPERSSGFDFEDVEVEGRQGQEPGLPFEPPSTGPPITGPPITGPTDTGPTDTSLAPGAPTTSVVPILPAPPVQVEQDPSSAWGAVNLIAVPTHVRDLIFEGEVVEPYLAGVDGAGTLAIGVYLVVVVGSLGLLVHRYRWLEA